MKFHIVEQPSEGQISFRAVESQIHPFCNHKITNKNPLCQTHYEAAFEGPWKDSEVIRSCPFGLLTTKPTSDSQTRMVISGMGEPNGSATPAELGRVIAEAGNLWLVMDKASGAAYKRQYSLLEDALHEVRHSNARILQTAELGLVNLDVIVDGSKPILEQADDEAKKRLAQIYLASQELSQILDLYEVARDPAFARGDDIKPIDFRALFQRGRDTSQAWLEQNNLSFEIIGECEKLRLSEHAVLLPKIFIDNAILYARKSSCINVSLEGNASRIEFRIKNYGVLVSDDELAKVFTRSYRGKNKGLVRGRGIGLYLAKQIVMACKGEIDFSVARDSISSNTGFTEVRVSLLAEVS